MTNEHFFPRWLIEYANAFHEGIQWIEPEKRISAEKATVPLCDECNNAFGTTLEGPVSKIFRSIEAHRPLSDADAELLVRWMWKFEGLQWYLLAAADSPHAVYSERYTLRERVTASYAFNDVRRGMMLAAATCHANDPGFKDWPLGLDTAPAENAIHMSGVFGRIAILTSLVEFEHVIPDCFAKYRFGPPPQDRNAPVFEVPCTFIIARGAIEMTRKTSERLTPLHDGIPAERKWQQSGGPSILFPKRRRVELPPV